MTPFELCEQYAKGQIDRSQLVAQLSSYPYPPSDRTDGYDSLLVDPPGSFLEVERARVKGLIDGSIYSEVVEALILASQE